MPTNVEMDVHIDDIMLTNEGGERVVVDELQVAHEMLTDTIRGDVKGKVAEEKTAVAASSWRVAKELRTRLKVEEGVQSAAVALGIDQKAGARRGRGGGKLTKRMSKAVKRRGRLRRLRKEVGGSKAVKIFATGIQAAATFGAQVWGLTGAEVAGLRRLAGQAMAPKGRGRSLTLAHLLYDEPTAEAEVAPIIQYHRMVWKAVQRQNFGVGGKEPGLVKLREWWREAEPGFRNLSERMKMIGSKEGRPEWRRRCARMQRRAWAEVRGPIGAAAICLARVGWRFDEPLMVRDADGNEVVLTKTAPKMLKAMLTQAVRRKMEEYLGQTWEASDVQFHGRSACVDLLRRDLKSHLKHGTLCRMQVGAAKSAACGAVMTMSKARAWGYDVQDRCPLCGEEGDTLFHRTYECKETRKAVQEAVPAWFWKEAMRARTTDKFWTSACFPHPRDVATPPTTGMHYQVGGGRGSMIGTILGVMCMWTDRAFRRPLEECRELDVRWLRWGRTGP